MQTNGFQHWIHFIIIISNIWIHFIKNIFKNEMDPVFWVLFFSEALGPIPNWILFRFPIPLIFLTRNNHMNNKVLSFKNILIKQLM